VSDVRKLQRTLRMFRRKIMDIIKWYFSRVTECIVLVGMFVLSWVIIFQVHSILPKPSTIGVIGGLWM